MWYFNGFGNNFRQNSGRFGRDQLELVRINRTLEYCLQSVWKVFNPTENSIRCEHDRFQNKSKNLIISKSTQNYVTLVSGH